MAQARNSGASVIAAMHIRFEATSAEYNDMDERHTALSRSDEDSEDRKTLMGAMINNMRESNVLREAILWQRPATMAEATLLAFHISLAHDGRETATEEQQEALAAGIDTLFAFMAEHNAGAVRSTLGTATRDYMSLVTLVSSKRGRSRVGAAA